MAFKENWEYVYASCIKNGKNTWRGSWSLFRITVFGDRARHLPILACYIRAQVQSNRTEKALSHNNMSHLNGIV